MKKIVAFICSFLLITSISVVLGGEKAPQKVIDLANKKLVPLGKDPVIIKAVKAENAKGKTLAQIKEMDKKWKATPGIVDYMKALMESACAKHLNNIQKSSPYYAEIFIIGFCTVVNCRIIPEIFPVFIHSGQSNFILLFSRETEFINCPDFIFRYSL